MSCKTILPTNISKVINILDVVGCTNLQELKKNVKKIETLYEPNKIDKRFLNLLLKEFGADLFSSFEEDERELIKFAQMHYKRLGTISSLKEVFKALGIEAEVIEWFDSGKKPFTFDLDLSASKREITPELIKKLKKLIAFAKNVRSSLDEIKLSYLVKNTQHLFYAGVGEVECVARQIEGYLCSSRDCMNITTSCICEISN